MPRWRQQMRKKSNMKQKSLIYKTRAKCYLQNEQIGALKIKKTLQKIQQNGLKNKIKEITHK